MVSQPPVATLLPRLMTRDTIGMKSSKRPLLRRVISGSTSSSVAQSPPHAAITILTNPARTRAHLAPSTVHEEETLSQLSTVCRPSLPSPTPSHTYSRQQPRKGTFTTPYSFGSPVPFAPGHHHSQRSGEGETRGSPSESQEHPYQPLEGTFTALC